MKCPQCGGYSPGAWKCQTCYDIAIESNVAKIPLYAPGKPKDCKTPVPYPPGDERLILTMQKRFLDGLTIFHPLDGKLNATLRTNDTEENNDNEIEEREFLSKLLFEFRRQPGYSSRVQSVGRFVRVSGNLTIENPAYRTKTN